MARITVEDCLQRIGSGNRFDLIRLASQRIRQRRKGAPCLVEGKNKELVMTLREIAAGAVTHDNIVTLAQDQRRGRDQAAGDEPVRPSEARAADEERGGNEAVEERDA